MTLRARVRCSVSTRRGVVLAVGLLLPGCGESARSEAGDGTAPAVTRPAAKTTCADVVLDPDPSLGVIRTSRELVAFSPTLLGVETTWAGDGFTAETVAGGYVDDLTEAYDDLRPTGTMTVQGGAEAEILRGRLLGDSVVVAVWRDPAFDVPCDVRALVITGAERTTEEELLDGLR